MSWVQEYIHQTKAADELLARPSEPDGGVEIRRNELIEAQVRATLALAAAVLLAAEDDES